MNCQQKYGFLIKTAHCAISTIFNFQDFVTEVPQNAWSQTNKKDKSYQQKKNMSEKLSRRQNRQL